MSLSMIMAQASPEIAPAQPAGERPPAPLPGQPSAAPTPVPAPAAAGTPAPDGAPLPGQSGGAAPGAPVQGTQHVTTTTQQVSDQQGKGGAPGFLEGYGMPLFILVIFFFMWFFVMRPQSKREKEIRKKQSELKNGDMVVTTAGIIGKVVGLDGDRVTLQVDQGTRIPFRREAIITFLADTAGKDEKSK